MKGTVQLYKNDIMVVSGVYGCRADRKKILEKWERLYSKKFSSCIVNIIPYDGGSINYKGMNCRLGEAGFEIDDLIERSKSVKVVETVRNNIWNLL